MSGLGSSIVLSPEDSHYIRDVLRLDIHSSLELGDTTSGEIFLARLANVDDKVLVHIESRLEEPRVESGSTILLFALCKGSKNDLVCDWATELGCSRIVFWQSERSVTRLRNREETKLKADRLSKIARAAAQQSKQCRPPQILVVASLAEAVAAVGDVPNTRPFVCSLSPHAMPIRDAVTDRDSGTIIVVGPEGDLSPAEETLLTDAGYLPVSLGHRVLRSELAAVTAITATRI